jgi:hypothetical protein
MHCHHLQEQPGHLPGNEVEGPGGVSTYGVMGREIESRRSLHRVVVKRKKQIKNPVSNIEINLKYYV